MFYVRNVAKETAQFFMEYKPCNLTRAKSLQNYNLHTLSLNVVKVKIYVPGKQNFLGGQGGDDVASECSSDLGLTPPCTKTLARTCLNSVNI